jgi:hypothetical protein
VSLPVVVLPAVVSVLPVLPELPVLPVLPVPVLPGRTLSLAAFVNGLVESLSEEPLGLWSLQAVKAPHTAKPMAIRGSFIFIQMIFKA